jgi:GT2 family glycosyltransferase
MHPKVAVVILNYNGKKFLEAFLKGVVDHSKPYEVVVADNASTDDSVNYLSTHFPELRLIQNTSNTGYAGGYAAVLSKLDHDYFVLLNNDVEVSANWLDSLVSIAQAKPEIGAIQPKLLSYHQKNLFEYAGAAGGFIDTYGYPFCRGRVFDAIEEDNGQYNEAGPIFWASGACMFVRRKALEEAGGLDADYFAHMEEIDLCWRMKNIGYQVYYQPQSVVYHVGGGTLNKVSPNKTFLNFRNSLITLVKNDAGHLFLKILVRLILDGVAGLKFLLEGKAMHCLAIIKAHFSFYGMLGNSLKKRKQLMAHENYKATDGPVLKGGLVWQFYALKRKNFKQLKPKII